MDKTKTAKKTTKKSSVPSGRSRLSSLGGGSSKSKSATPSRNVTEEEALQIEAIDEAKDVVAAAKSALGIAEDNFRDQATDHFENQCREDGKLHTSIRLTGKTGQNGTSKAVAVLYTQKKQCKEMKEADATDPLRATFGKDFDDLFGIQQTLKINTNILSDEQINDALAALEQVLGDQYDDAIDADCIIVPREDFYRRRILDDRIRKLAQRASDEDYAKVYKASFKIPS